MALLAPGLHPVQDLPGLLNGGTEVSLTGLGFTG